MKLHLEEKRGVFLLRQETFVQKSVLLWFLPMDLRPKLIESDVVVVVAGSSVVNVMASVNVTSIENFRVCLSFEDLDDVYCSQQ